MDSKAGQGAMGKAPAASPDIAEKEKKKTDSVMLQEVVRTAEDVSLNCERVADRTQISVERSAEDTQSPSFPHNATEMDELDEKQLDDALLYLRCHVRLGLLSRNKMFALAAAGHLPKRILRCNPPLCPSCQFGRQTRKSFYRKKGGTISGPHKVEKVGDLVHVDQIESSVAGFVGQVRGKLTTARYKVVTVFVDDFSKYIFVHLQQSTSGEETLKGKHLFEQYLPIIIHSAHCGGKSNPT